MEEEISHPNETINGTGKVNVRNREQMTKEQ